ncbi:GNAT family protein [Lactobacillus sp. ESL0791]|uniref:GNAT family N-acetyltransferase n=1 Tax=Lactobacillus sp. ESL0791 TaxID=2983234 RepID=UPI0023F7E6FF|nr:GNAT family protein [Lactobacillus sp. ESL0791]MDF7638239.1 GNAT family protein [Lactobacillus sp. ESL0791]
MFTCDSFNINGQEVELVLPEKQYAKDLAEIVNRNCDQFKQWFTWAETPASEASEQGFIEMARTENAIYKMLVLIILVDGKTAGTLDLHNIHQYDRRAEIGYWLDSRYQGCGIMTTAVKHLVQIAFTKMELHKLVLLADHNNLKSRAVAERVGFIHEALLRDQIKYSYGYGDLDEYCLINEEE